MYKITILQSGECSNVNKGSRYCFRKKTMKNLAKDFISWGCDITIEKWTRLCEDIFCWSDANTKGFFIDQIEEEMKKEKETKK